MRSYIVLLAIMLTPLVSIAQLFEIKPIVVGSDATEVVETMRCDDIRWEIESMDPETSIEVLRENNLFTFLGMHNGVIDVATGCKSNGAPDIGNVFFASVSAPLSIRSGTIVRVTCPPGAYVRINKYVGKR